jgi:hypothetical protein
MSNQGRGLKSSTCPSGISRRRLLARGAVLTGGALLLGGSHLMAAAKTSAKVDRKQAIADIPFDKLNAPTRTKIQGVIDDVSVYRRLPVQVVNADPELHVFLIRYPEVVVNMWELMGITKVQLRRIAPYLLQSHDGAGTIGTAELVYGDQDTHVIYGKGYYEGNLVRKRINGECVLLLKTAYTEAEDGRVYITNRLDVFVSIRNIGAELIAKTLQPVIGKTADHNFVESTKFLAQISQQAAINRGGMQRLAGKLKRVDGQVRAEFSRIAVAANDRAQSRVDKMVQGPKKTTGG